MAERSVFVSCGQLTADERALGLAVAAKVRDQGMQPFIAQEVHSAGDLNSNVFEALKTCGAFVGILQKRGTVTFLDYPASVRSSVWIQQEFSIFCYRMFLERRSLPVRIYSEEGIRREGVMEIALANPIPFTRPESILDDITSWLAGPEFAEHPVLATREEMFRRRFAETDSEQKLVIELVAAHCLQAGDSAPYSLVRDDFVAILVAKGLGRDAAVSRLSTALGRLGDSGLVSRTTDINHPVHLWIAKQWYALVLDELRRQGGRL